MIRLSKSCLSETESRAVLTVLDEEYLGMGSYVQIFEQELSDFFDRTTLCVSSGTAALHLALQSLALQPGDEVLVPSLTYVATFQAITASGATPIACDIDPSTLQIDLTDAALRVTNNTKVILPVHYAGSASSLPSIYSFAEHHSLRVVEDAAHAFGSLSHNQKVGSVGDIVCFSFDGIKNITSGEGGCIVTSDPLVLQRVSDDRLLGVRNDSSKRYAGQRSWDFDVLSQGWRYHMSNINAAIGSSQLKRLSAFKLIKKQLTNHYLSLLSDISGLSTLSLYSSDIIPHIFVVLLDPNVDRLKLRNFLSSKDIQTGIHYPPNHLLSRFKTCYRLPHTESVFPRLLSLPFHCDMSLSDVETVVSALQQFFSDQ